MKRTIIIHNEEKDIEIPVKATIKAMQIYRTEFGSDLSKDLSAVFDALNPDPFTDAMKRANLIPGMQTTEEMQQKILENLDYSMIHMEDPIPDEETQIKVLQIVWAMAKAANPELAAFSEWIDSLDMQPIRSLAESVRNIWKEAGKTTIELKN